MIVSNSLKNMNMIPTLATFFAVFIAVDAISKITFSVDSMFGTEVSEKKRILGKKIQKMFKKNLKQMGKFWINLGFLIDFTAYVSVCWFIKHFNYVDFK